MGWLTKKYFRSVARLCAQCEKNARAHSSNLSDRDIWRRALDEYGFRGWELDDSVNEAHDFREVLRNACITQWHRDNGASGTNLTDAQLAEIESVVREFA